MAMLPWVREGSWPEKGLLSGHMSGRFTRFWTSWGAGVEPAWRRREEEEAETSCEAFQPVSRLELFYLLNSLPAEQFSAGEQRQCREGIFPQGLNALTVPGPKPVLSGAAWWFHGETRGLKQENRVVLLRHSSAHFASISHMVLSACYVLGIMLYSRDKQEEAPSLQCLPFYRVYRGVTLGMNSQWQVL